MLIQFLSMIAWTHAVLGVFYIYIDLDSRSQEYKKASYACVLCLYLHLFSAVEDVSHEKVL